MASNVPPSISSKTIHIAGILTTIYGLSELSSDVVSLSCLWLHHPRLQTKENMQDVAITAITQWNERHRPDRPQVGLMAVAFDQRNHGTREVNATANGTWKDGNETHAQDMFSIIQGTVLDTSLLIDHLESYIFDGSGRPSVDEHLVLGVSLGGHSAWQVLFNEPRVTTAIAVIGCPDYLELISDRARRLNRESYTLNSGKAFAGSRDYPISLLHAVNRIDPKGMLFCNVACPTTTPSADEQARLKPLLDARIKNKNILVQSGGVDKLVPYACSKPFLDFLKDAASEHGWYADGGFQVDDRVYADVGHKFTPQMLAEAVEFIIQTIGRDSRSFKSASRSS